MADKEYEWAQVTLGQNETISRIASKASKASSLVDANVKFAKVALELGKVLLLAMTNPALLALVAIADEIDDFVDDLKGTGFYVLEVTPTGNEVLPKDAEGDPIALALSPIALSATYAAAVSSGLVSEFTSWSKEFLGVPQPELGFPKAQYSVEQGKSLSDDIAEGRVNNDALTTRNALFGFDTMTPSQVIATMIAAMDDKLDDRRPQFSDSADVAAIIVVIGFADLTKDMKDLKEVLGLFIAFFGGENGLFTKGLRTIFEAMAEAIAAIDDTTIHTSTITVGEVCGVRGTTEDRKVLQQLIPQSQWDEHAKDASAYYYNYSAQFEVGDLIVGPFAKFNGRAIGYVSKVIDTTKDEEDEATGAPYVTQTLEITCLGVGDKGAFDSIGNGSIIQKVAYFKNQKTWIDQNTGETVEGPEYNDYKYMKDLTYSEASSVAKVERKAGELLLTELSTSSVVETHGGRGAPGTGGFQTKNHVQGEILQSKEKKVGPPPNFKAVKLEDFITELGGFFAQIQLFTDSLRKFAAGAIESITKITDFIDTMIEELERLNKIIQDILRIFTIGLPDSGVYSLSIPSTTGGNNAIKKALEGATNGPPNSLDYSVGFMMVGGAAAIDPLLTLISGD